MGDPARIERITVKLATLWSTQPGIRFGELIFHVGFASGRKPGFFNFGDVHMEKIIDAALVASGYTPESFACGGDVIGSAAAIIEDEAVDQVPHLGYMRHAGAHMRNYDVVRTDLDR